MRRSFLILICLCLSACSNSEQKTSTPNQPAMASLPDFFDCVRENENVLISAHRGGPAPGFPENAIETFANTAGFGLPMLEIDIQSSRDGVLFLYHDDRLGRTSTGSGIAKSKTWAYLSKQTLKAPDGKVTRFAIPTFEQALIWARQNDAILQVDIKRGTSYRKIVQMIRKTGMSNRVMLITYTRQQANTLHPLAPTMVLSVSADTPEQIEGLLRSNIPTNLMIGWTGLGEPKPALYARLNDLGIEAIAGTLGPVDKKLARTGDLKSYRIYARSGASIIATDRVFAVDQALTADENILQSCPLPNIN